jgi:hypothetical protein
LVADVSLSFASATAFLLEGFQHRGGQPGCRSARARRTPVMWHDWNDSLKLDEVIEEARCMIPLIAMKQTYK